MAVPMRRPDFGADHEMAPIPVLDDVAVIDRLGEARPAGAAVELVDGREQRLARDDVDVKTGLVVIPVLTRERRFGAALLSYLLLLGRQCFDGRGILAVLVCHGPSLTRQIQPGRGRESSSASCALIVDR